MNYTIGEVAKKLKLAPSTLRYYDKEGLLPFVARKDSGIRIFSDTDLQWLDIIECLKMTGMPIKDIKIFIDWCIQGDSTLQKRHDMFMERKEIVEKQMAALQKTMDTINYKCWYYETALKAGTEKIHQDIKPEHILELTYTNNNGSRN